METILTGTPWVNIIAIGLMCIVVNLFLWWVGAIRIRHNKLEQQRQDALWAKMTTEQKTEALLDAARGRLW